MQDENSHPTLLSKKHTGRKKVKHDRASAYQKIDELSELAREKRKNERLRKAAYRLKKREEQKYVTDSPKSDL